MSNENNDFYIKDGMLKKYLGSESFVIIPEGVRKIGDYVFACCSLVSVTIPSSVAEIGDHAFSGCSRLVSITIPSGVTKLDRDVFSSCDSLKEIHYDGTRAQWLFELSGMQRVRLDISVYCSDGIAEPIPGDITELFIPEGVKSIGELALAGFRLLQFVKIPSTVTRASA